MVKVLSFVLVLNGIYTLYGGYCEGSVPLSDGTWLTSSRGTWSVNSTTIDGFSSSLSLDTPTSTLVFVSSQGTLYLFNTTTVIFDVTITLYTCLDIQIASAPLFYIVTVFNSTVNDQFTGDSGAACSNPGYQTVDNRNIVVQQGAETSTTSTLPNVIRGEYSVNVTSTSGVTSDGVTLDACNDTTVLRFNNSGTSQNVGFSNDGYLTSLYSIQIGAIIYLYTYNNDSTVDSTTTYRLVCSAISYYSAGIAASAYPGVCQTDQNSTYTPTGGQLFTFTPSLTCASPDESSGSDNTVIIVIVVICIIVVVVIIIVFIVYWMKKSKRKTTDKETLQQDSTTSTRDASVATSMDTGDGGSFCIPWLGRGTKSTSTSTTDLSAITFYLPLKYTKRPGDVANGAPASKRPRPVQRSHTTLSAVRENHDDRTSKPPRRFIPYVGVVKKDTKTKPVINSHWPNGTAKPIKEISDIKPETAKTKDTSSKSVNVQDELTRAKTFHDFEREFEEKNKFPVDIGSTEHRENKTTKHVTIGNVTEFNDTSAPRYNKKNVIRVRSQEELERIPDETKGSNSNRPDTKGSFRRTKSLPPTSRSVPGRNYTSPYAMSREQKEFFAKRREWASLQHNHEEAKQNWLKEMKKKESANAYHNWIRYKTMMAEQMRASFEPFARIKSNGGKPIPGSKSK